MKGGEAQLVRPVPPLLGDKRGIVDKQLGHHRRRTVAESFQRFAFGNQAWNITVHRVPDPRFRVIGGMHCPERHSTITFRHPSFSNLQTILLREDYGQCYQQLHYEAYTN